jgi:hypothetical protein
MTKIALTLIITLFGMKVFAAANYVGTWCQKHDDFTEVLVIKEDGKAQSYVRGKVETSPIKNGFVSLGASHFQIVMDGMDTGVVDYKIRKALFSEKRILTLIDSEREKHNFRECELKSR